MENKSKRQQQITASCLLVLGTILWRGTLIVRTHLAFKNGVFDFLLGGMPNFGTAWMLPSFLLLIGTIFLKRSLSKGEISTLLIATFVLQCASESYYAYFGTANFEWLDLGFGVVALIGLKSALSCRE